MTGYLQRLEYLRDYFHGDKPVNTIMQAPMIVELLNSIIKDIPKPKCACQEFSYKTYTAQFVDFGKHKTIAYAGHYHCGALKALATKCADGIITTWEGGNIVKIEDLLEGKII